MKKAVLLLVCVLFTFSLKLSAQDNPANRPAEVFKGAPSPADAVIYEVNVPHFSNEGNLSSLTAGLDSIKALGANVIYLMPIYPIGEIKSFGSPYCVRDYTTVNKSLGTIADLRELVNAAHQKNMAVILDWVGNHTSFDHPWLANPDWYVRDVAGNALSPPNKGWNDVAQLNYNNAGMREAMVKAMKYWIINAGVDGFRCDYADGPPIDFWKKAITSIRKVSKNKTLFLAESGTKAVYKAGFDLISGFDFYNNLKQVYRDNKTAKSIVGINDQEYSNAATRQQVAGYITNHDLMGSDGPVSKVFGSREGAVAAFVVAVFTQGTPIIYNGQETLSANNGTLHAKINPDYKKILALRNSSDAIKRGHITSFSNDDVYVIKKDYGTESILLICNLRNRNAVYTVPASLSKAVWKDGFTSAKQPLGSVLRLAPYEYLILKVNRR